MESNENIVDAPVVAEESAVAEAPVESVEVVAEPVVVEESVEAPAPAEESVVYPDEIGG